MKLFLSQALGFTLFQFPPHPMGSKQQGAAELSAGLNHHSPLPTCLGTCSILTFAVGVQVKHTARPHHGLQGDDFVQGHPEQLVVVELPRWGMMRFVRTEIVVAKGEALLSEGAKGTETQIRP